MVPARPTSRNRSTPMRSGFVIGFLFALSSFCIAQPKVPAGPTLSEQQIIDLERDRLKAFAQADKAKFEQFVTEDLTIVHGGGEILDKAQEMANMRPSTPDRPLPVLTIEQPKV